ncbi:MAG: hypothetical protein WCI27_11295, partial [Candidatus Omnitrophota bacterium]
MLSKIFLRNIFLFLIFVLTPFLAFSYYICLPGFWEFKIHVFTRDTLTCKYAFFHYFYGELCHGRVPFWCHSVAAGVPIFAQVKFGLLYPLNLINLFLSPSTAILPLV